MKALTAFVAVNAIDGSRRHMTPSFSRVWPAFSFFSEFMFDKATTVSAAKASKLFFSLYYIQQLLLG